MVTLDNRPTRDIAGETFAWTAGYNPVIYEFTRRDDTFTSMTRSGNQLTIVRNDATADDTNIFLVSGLYKSRATVISGAGTSTITVVPETFNNYSDSVNGYYNLLTARTNYRIEVRIFEVGSDNLLGVRNVTPGIDGILSLDLSDFIGAFFDHSDGFDYAQVNRRARNKSVKFYITYQEIYDGSSEAVVSDATNPVFAVDAAKQIGDTNGQNMAEHVPLNDINAADARFLSTFEIPKVWAGYPFSIDFVYSEYFPTTALQRVQQELNVNKAPISGQASTQLIADEQQSVNRLLLDNISDDARFVNLQINTGVAIQDNYVFAGYVNAGYVENI